MVSEFKETRKRLRKAIERCKKERWKEFCATLDQDPWGRPYRVVQARMARGLPPKGLSKDRAARILEDLFITRRAEQEGEDHSSRSPQMLEEEEQDLRVTNEDLRTASTKYLRSPGEIVRIIVEQRPGRLLDLFNNMNRSGRIPAVWRVVRVVLLPKPVRDPLFPLSYRPISILPALSKVWEHTCKMLIEWCLGRDPLYREQ